MGKGGPFHLLQLVLLSADVNVEDVKSHVVG